MNGEPKAARESSEANWKSLEASLAAVEREVKIMAERIRRNVILDLLKPRSAQPPGSVIRALIGDLPGRLGTGKPAADDVHCSQALVAHGTRLSRPVSGVANRVG